MAAAAAPVDDADADEEAEEEAPPPPPPLTEARLRCDTNGLPRDKQKTITDGSPKRRERPEETERRLLFEIRSP